MKVSERLKAWWAGKRKKIGILMFFFFGIQGFIPLDFAIPVWALVYGRQKIFLATSGYLALYVVCFSASIYIIMQYGGGRAFLEKGKIGRSIIKILQHKTTNRHTGLKWVAYEAWYHLQLVIYGFTPLAIKFGVCRCSLYLKLSALAALIAGTTIRAYLLAYLGTDALHWLSALFRK